MAKMKWDDDIDWKGLNEEEYSEEGDYEPYDGPEPPANTLLDGEIKKIWLTESSNGNMMFKVLFEAGEDTEYPGCPIWENVVFTSPGAKFKWQPFMDALGISLKDIKAKTMVGEEDNVGTVVEKIGKVEFPCDIRVRTGVQKKGEYKGKVQVAKWLAPVDSEDDDGDDDDTPF